MTTYQLLYANSRLIFTLFLFPFYLHIKYKHFTGGLVLQKLLLPGRIVGISENARIYADRESFVQEKSSKVFIYGTIHLA